MEIMIIVIVLLIISILYLFAKLQKTKKDIALTNNEIIKFNEELEEKNKKLIIETNANKIQYEEMMEQIASTRIEASSLTTEVNSLRERKVEISNELQRESNNLNTLKQNINENLENQKRIAEEALESYKSNLDNKYKQIDEGYNELIQKLENVYSARQSELFAESHQILEDLEKIRASKAAAIQAQLREKEIEENSSFYCLEISDIDKMDITKLETVKTTLNNPRILSMLIWQTYFQKPLKTKTAEILKTSNRVTGIYKITNIKTKECYIGQAVDIATRWTEHAKAGLGIDTPVKNKLYKAMQEYGLYNFSWELLEECPQSQLNEKEKYYINLYESYTYGYNSNTGNSK